MKSECLKSRNARRSPIPEPRYWGFVVLMFLASFTGCGQSETDPPVHHRGHFVDLPGHEQMQLELAVDEERRQLVVDVVEAETHQPMAISSENLEITFQVEEESIPITLDANPRPTDPEGQSSRFAIGSDDLPEALRTVVNFTAQFSFEVEGQVISGTLDHKDDHTHHYD